MYERDSACSDSVCGSDGAWGNDDSGGIFEDGLRRNGCVDNYGHVYISKEESGLCSGRMHCADTDDLQRGSGISDPDSHSFV